MKVYVINLRDEAQRRNSMESGMKRAGIKAQFVDAVNGSKFTDQDLKDILKEQYGKRLFFNTKSFESCKGTLACSMSHLKIWLQMIHDKVPIACICEDDINVDQNLGNILNQLDASMRGYGHIKLIHASPWTLSYTKGCEASIWGRQNLDRGYSLSKPCRLAVSNACYVLTLESARILAHEILPFRAWPDYITGSSELWNIKTAILTPPLALDNELATSSSIGRIEKTTAYDIVTYDQIGKEKQLSPRDRLFEYKIKIFQRKKYLKELSPLRRPDSLDSQQMIDQIKPYLDIV